MLGRTYICVVSISRHHSLFRCVGWNGGRPFLGSYRIQFSHLTKLWVTFLYDFVEFRCYLKITSVYSFTTERKCRPGYYFCHESNHLGTICVATICRSREFDDFSWANFRICRSSFRSEIRVKTRLAFFNFLHPP